MPTITLTIFTVISLLVFFLGFSTCQSSGDCDVIITTSSFWKCNVEEHDVTCLSEVKSKVRRKDDVGFRLPKNISTFRLCVDTLPNRPVSIGVSASPPAENMTPNCRQDFKEVPDGVGCEEKPLIRVWQKKAPPLLRHRRSTVDENDIIMRGRDKLFVTRWRNHASDIPVRETAGNGEGGFEWKIIRKRKSATGKTRLPRSASGDSDWSPSHQICGKSFLTFAPFFNSSSSTRRATEEACLYSLINKLIVDVRWSGLPLHNISFFLVFHFERTSVSTASNVKGAAPGHTVSPERNPLTTRGRSTIKSSSLLLICIPVVVFLIVLAFVVFCVFLRRNGSGSEDRGWCDICRTNAPPQRDHRRAHEQPTTRGLLCCCCKPEVAGTNPTPAPRNNNYDICCCSSKESCLLATTRHVHSSASQSHLVTSHSSMSPSRSGSSSFGLGSSHVTTPSFMGGKLNNPYAKATSCGVVPNPPHRTSSETGRCKGPDYSVRSRPPPNRTHFATDSAVIAALNGRNFTTHVTRKQRHREESRTKPNPAERRPHEVASLLSPSNARCPTASLTPGDDDPPPEYSEPPDYYAVV
uniref:Uncharacterized protein LOC100178925 n=1 Tax=Phallusia mammillata TaxID=59560 RepID=A0A6F9DHU1_9ASCI|nr:uncharacterized protein LOC100178925 [Phallusia mammillata]